MVMAIGLYPLNRAQNTDLKGHAFAGMNRKYVIGVAPGTLGGQSHCQAAKPSYMKDNMAARAGASWHFATYDAGTVPQLRRSSGVPNALDPMGAMPGQDINKSGAGKTYHMGT